MSLLFLMLLLVPLSASANDLGELSANPYQQNSTANPFGAGSPFAPNGINNPFSPYGSPFSNQSATNPFATDAPRLYDGKGNYRGKLSANPYREPFCLSFRNRCPRTASSIPIVSRHMMFWMSQSFTTYA